MYWRDRWWVPVTSGTTPWAVGPLICIGSLASLGFFLGQKSSHAFSCPATPHHCPSLPPSSSLLVGAGCCQSPSEPVSRSSDAAPPGPLAQTPLLLQHRLPCLSYMSAYGSSPSGHRCGHSPSPGKGPSLAALQTWGGGRGSEQWRHH